MRPDREAISAEIERRLDEIPVGSTLTQADEDDPWERGRSRDARKPEPAAGGAPAALQLPGDFACFGRCGARLEWPGHCARCADAHERRKMLDEISGSLRAAERTIPDTFQWARDFDYLRAHVPVAASLRSRLTEFLAVRSVVIVGHTGLGKTAAVVSMLDYIIAAARAKLGIEGRHLAGARFVPARALKPPGDEPARFNEAMKASILFLDDAGKEADGGDTWLRSQRVEHTRHLLETRYDAGHTTIITTYLREDAFARLYDGGNERRYWRAHGALVVDLENGG